MKENGGLVFLDWLLESLAQVSQDDVREARLENSDEPPRPGEEIIGVMTNEHEKLFALWRREKNTMDAMLRAHAIGVLKEHIEKLRSGETKDVGGVIDIGGNAPEEITCLASRAETLKVIFWQEVKSRFGDKAIDGNLGIRQGGRIVTWPDSIQGQIAEILARAATGR